MSLLGLPVFTLYPKHAVPTALIKVYKPTSTEMIGTTFLGQVPVGALRRGACNERDAAAHLHVDPLDVRGQHVLVVQQHAAPIALHRGIRRRRRLEVFV